MNVKVIVDVERALIKTRVNLESRESILHAMADNLNEEYPEYCEEIYHEPYAPFHICRRYESSYLK